MNPSQVPLALLLWLLGQPALVTAFVSWMKRYPFVAKNPKEIAALLNVFANVVIGSFLFGSLPQTLNQGLVQFLMAAAQTLGSTGYYEWVKPVVLPPGPTVGS